MIADIPAQIVGIACSVFRRDLESLRDAGNIRFPVRYLDSMLHMCPGKLHCRLQSLIDEERRRDHQVLLIYGECHDQVSEQESEPGVWRVKDRNCAEILLGSVTYEKLRHEGVFFLLPEWTRRWREIFEDGLGLAGSTRRDFMQEMHTRLLYLDTGRTSVPVEHLQEASQAFGLEWEVMSVGAENLLFAIREALERMTPHGH